MTRNRQLIYCNRFVIRMTHIISRKDRHSQFARASADNAAVTAALASSDARNCGARYTSRSIAAYYSAVLVAETECKAFRELLVRPAHIELP